MEFIERDLASARRRRDDLIILSAAAHEAVLAASRGTTFADRATGRVEAKRRKAREAAAFVDERLRAARAVVESLETVQARMLERRADALAMDALAFGPASAQSESDPSDDDA